MNTLPAIYRDTNEELIFQRAKFRAQRELFPPREIEEVFRSYGIPESQLFEIIGFLISQPRLIPVLINAVPYLEEVFGEAKRYLELELDRDDGSEELFCVVLVVGEPEFALNLLSKFDNAWLPRSTAYIRRRLNFTVETENDEPL